MTLNYLLFFLILITIVCAFFIIHNYNAVYSAIALVFTNINITFFLLFLQFDNLAILFTLITGGAVAMFFLIVVLLFSIKETESEKRIKIHPSLTFILTFIFFWHIQLNIFRNFILIDYTPDLIPSIATYLGNDTQINLFGDLLYGIYAPLILISGIILLIPIIVTIIIFFVNKK